jgi:hypothetical protein
VTVETDPLANARTELMVTRDDLRETQRALERERSRVDFVRDRLSREVVNQASAVSFVRAVHGAESAAAVRNLLAGVQSHPEPAEDVRTVEDYGNNLRTAVEVASRHIRGAHRASSFTEIIQLLAVEHLQLTLTAAADETLARLRDEYAATIELIRAELDDRTDRTAREERILNLIRDIDGSGLNSDRSRRELASAQATVRRLRQEHPADVR